MSWNGIGMPPILEDGVNSRVGEIVSMSQQQHDNINERSEQNSLVDELETTEVSEAFKTLEGSKLEPLMLSILEQREKLNDQLQKTHARIEENEKKMVVLEKQRDSFKNRLEFFETQQPAEFSTLSRELAQCREVIMEKNEEIVELKAERNNTRLLLEHLECLVSKHEKALRMTVVKRHSQATRESVSSEVEVLKALKSLFEHHKALDEKVRERLNVAVKRVQSLELDLNTKIEENIGLKSKLAAAKINEAEPFLAEPTRQTSESSQLVAKLQEQLERQNQDLVAGSKQISELSFRNTQLETQLSNSEREAQLAREKCETFEHSMVELQKTHSDYESRISIMENRLLTAQDQTLSAQQQVDRLQCELTNKEGAARINEEKILAMQERLELAENQLAQSLKQLPSTEALIQKLTIKHSSAEERIQQLENLLKERGNELDRAIQREKMNEQANQRLSSTVDKLLLESNDRLQLHLKERMHAQLERNRLIQSQEQARKLFDQIEREKERILAENESLRKEIEILRNLLYSARTTQFYSRFGDVPTAEAQKLYPITTSSPLATINGTRSQTTTTMPESVSHLKCQPTGIAPPIIKRQQKARLSALKNDTEKVRTLGEQEWDRLQQNEVLKNVHQAFSTSNSMAEGVSAGIDGLITESSTVISEGGAKKSDVQTAYETTNDSFENPTDPHTLAYMLQGSIDAINNEIRQIEEEKNRAVAENIFTDKQKHQQSGAIQQSNHFQHPNVFFPSIDDHSSLVIGRGDVFNHFSPRGSFANIYNATSGALINEPMPPDFVQHKQNAQYKGNEIYNGQQFLALLPLNTLPNGVVIGSDVPGIDSSHILQINHHNSHFENDTTTAHFSQMASTSSSISDIHELASNNFTKAATKSTPTLKRRSTSTSSGLKTLGRFFGGANSKKNKTILRRVDSGRIGGLTEHSIGAFSDSEVGNFNINGKTNLQTSMHESLSPVAVANQISFDSDFDKKKKRKYQLLEESMKARTPFALWNGPTVVAWLELWVHMPTWYVEACRANVKSGHIMSTLTEQNIQKEIGVNNPLHRLKLKLAIQEMVQLTSPSTRKANNISYYFRGLSSLTHEWIGNDWLPSLGLSQYRTDFMENLVDGRMLEHLSKKDLSKSLKLVDGFHRTSLQFGIICLKKLNYDQQTLEKRRKACEIVNKDLLVWSNQRMMQWVEEIGLGNYAKHLVDTGVHGALIALDETFDHNALATLLQLPHQDDIRLKLENDFKELIRDSCHAECIDISATPVGNKFKS